ncbi:hypothetical protein B0H63DRAFT_26593 [Podospora didyma]|uniref:Uncharacterized protein n=1 Tax=Podospora didyma TaxID=330526 RepID=A0AAE0P5K8_9PEZI|nr:hypothetical protein B0H63DRAFT_26593 [Podospora didyma]
MYVCVREAGAVKRAFCPSSDQDPSKGLVVVRLSFLRIIHFFLRTGDPTTKFYQSFKSCQSIIRTPFCRIACLSILRIAGATFLATALFLVVPPSIHLSDAVNARPGGNKKLALLFCGFFCWKLTRCRENQGGIARADPMAAYLRVKVELRKTQR